MNLATHAEPSVIELTDEDLFEITIETSPPRRVAEHEARGPRPFVPLVIPMQTPRLELRPYVEEDMVRVHRIYGDLDVMRTSGSAVAHTVDELRVHLMRRIGHQERHGFSAWAAFEKSSGELVGDAGLVEIDGTPDFELSYRFRKETWGRGYASEVAKAWVDLAFRTLGLEALRASVPKDNRAGARVLEQVGMKKISETRFLVSYGMTRDSYLGI